MDPTLIVFLMTPVLGYFVWTLAIDGGSWWNQAEPPARANVSTKATLPDDRTAAVGTRPDRPLLQPRSGH